MSNAINEAKAVPIGGIQQWVYIKGQDRKNPLILFLHGGPGLCESQFAHLYGPQLESRFTVVHWDQRGCNRSYSKSLPRETMTIENIVKDTVGLISYLLAEFKQSKLILAGHSWGTAIGMLVITSYSELISHYIGLGQFIDSARADFLSYDFVLDEAKKRGDSNAIKDLTDIGRPPFDQTSSIFMTVYLTLFGGNYFDPVRAQRLPEIIKSAPKNYQPVVPFRQMGKFSDDCLWKSVQALNMQAMVQQVTVPCYFMHGKTDYMTPLSLLEEFLNSSVFKSKKELTVFDECSHWPHHEQTKKFVETLDTILA